VNTLTPGDLTLSQITAVFAACDLVRERALEGCSEAEIAEELEWRREDVRTAARLQGFTLCDLVPRLALCPVCGALLEADGHCAVCVLRARLERLVQVNVEEHAREVIRLENDIDAVKQDTCRVRERMGTNPRKGRKEE
jgi:hypothetical protein